MIGLSTAVVTPAVHLLMLRDRNTDRKTGRDHDCGDNDVQMDGASTAAQGSTERRKSAEVHEIRSVILRHSNTDDNIIKSSTRTARSKGIGEESQFPKIFYVKSREEEEEEKEGEQSLKIRRFSQTESNQSKFPVAIPVPRPKPRTNANIPEQKSVATIGTPSSEALITTSTTSSSSSSGNVHYAVTARGKRSRKLKQGSYSIQSHSKTPAIA